MLRAEVYELGLRLYFKAEGEIELPKSDSLPVNLDVMYGEEDEAPYLLFTVEVGDAEFVAELPFGETWDAMEIGGFISVVLVEGDRERPLMMLSTDDYMEGFVAGARRLWEEISQTYD